MIKDDGSSEYIPIETLEEVDVDERELGTEKIYKAPNGIHFIFYPENVLSCFFGDEENTNIKEQIANAEFGDMFLTEDGSRALFLRLCENAEWQMADFYVEHWGMVRIDRVTGRPLGSIDETAKSITTIVKKA